MKTRFLTAVLLLATLFALLLSCAPEPPAPCVHTDVDKDYICDVCKDAWPKPTCTTHADANGDLSCDNCGETLPKKECTAHTDADGDLACDNCGTPADEAVAGWLLAGVPTYRGGTPSKALYLAGQGMDTAQLLENENLLQTVSDTTAAEFESYLFKLQRAGYQKEFYRAADTNLFASYIKGDVRVYAYFMSRRGEARIIKENAGHSASLTDFAYRYDRAAGEGSVLYQFALAMNDETHPKPDFKDNGMLYLLKLADNSVIIIDGANSGQMTNERRDELMQMLWDITGQQEGDTVRVAAWYVTHAHGDHYGGFLRFTWKYAKYLDLERVMFAFPSLHSPDEDLSTGSGAEGYRAIIDLIHKNYADDEPQFLRLHTGQSFQLADVTFEVLQTHEDLADAATGESKISSYNDASSILRLSVEGETVLFLGDAQEKVAMPRLLGNWSGEHLRADAVQLSHHVMNDLTPLYDVVRASVLLVPQAQYGIDKSAQRAAIFAAAKAHARADMIFLQNEQTVGIAVQNGRWEKVYSVPFAY
ncbi:MAG: hypothetical protein E7624_05625 [Ruminococcaceae bacterium]|nr:hypothetical protein [Oscillospiraceae bacterium]